MRVAVRRFFEMVFLGFLQWWRGLRELKCNGILKLAELRLKVAELFLKVTELFLKVAELFLKIAERLLKVAE